MKVLIVDDEFISRKYLSRLFKPHGHCDFAVNGEEAVEAFKLALQGGEPYDLVLLDLIMPDMDGQQALREMRALEREVGFSDGNETKILVVSVLEDNDDTHNAMYLAEATAMLQKPVDETRLFEEIRRLGLLNR